MDKDSHVIVIKPNNNAYDENVEGNQICKFYFYLQFYTTNISKPIVVI